MKRPHPTSSSRLRTVCPPTVPGNDDAADRARSTEGTGVHVELAEHITPQELEFLETLAELLVERWFRENGSSKGANDQ